MSRAWAVCLLFSAVSVAVFYTFAFQARAVMPSLVAGVFVALALSMLVGCVQRTLEFRRFGPLWLELAGEPAPGEFLEARLPLHAPEVRRLRASLVALEVVTDTDVKGRAAPREVERERSTLFFPVRAGIAEIRMRVPVPASTADRSWKLEVHAELPGADLNRTFALPVAAAATPPPVPAPPEPLELAEAAPAQPVSAVAVPLLVLANLVPLAGVLAWDWRLGDIVMLYWLENLVIGAFNVLRIVRAGAPGVPLFSKVPLAMFFAVHYGAFCLGHGVFLVAMFGDSGAAAVRPGIEETLLELLREPGLVLAVLALVVSHGYSYVRNYVGREEYRHAKPSHVMFRPYGRIVLVHIFVLGGGFLLQATQSPVAALVLFVAMKTVVDLAMHLRERKVLARPPAAR